MSGNLLQLIDEAIKLELNVAEIYLSFHKHYINRELPRLKLRYLKCP